MNMLSTRFNTSFVFFLLLVSGFLSQFNVALAQNNPFAGSYSGKFNYTITGDDEKKTGAGSFSLQVDAQGHVVVKSPPAVFEFDINTSGRSVLMGKFFGTQNSATGVGSIQFLKHNNKKVVSGAVTATSKSSDDDVSEARQCTLRFSGQGPQDISITTPSAKINPYAGTYSGKFKALSARKNSYSGDISVLVDKYGLVIVTGLPFQARFIINAQGSAHLTGNAGRNVNNWDDRLLTGDFQIQFRLGKGGTANFSGKGISQHSDGSSETATFSGSGTREGT